MPHFTGKQGPPMKTAIRSTLPFIQQMAKLKSANKFTAKEVVEGKVLCSACASGE